MLRARVASTPLQRCEVRMDQEKVAQVLRDAGTAMRAVATERDEAVDKLAEANAKLAAYERRTMAEKVAAQMHHKGINTDVEFSDLVSDLEKAASEGKLGTIENAVEMVGPDMSLKTASIHDSPRASGNAFEAFLLGGVG